MAAVAASCLAACGTEPVNRAPEVQRPIPDQTLTRGEGAATVDVANNFTDPDGDALTYTVSSTDSGVAAVSVSGSIVTVRPVATRTATATVTVRAQDPGGLAASLSFTVRVLGPDLVIGVRPDSVVGVPGVGFEYVAVVRNEGNAASVATRARTFMSADSVVTTSDDLVGDGAEVPALGARETVRRTASFTVSSSLSAGTVFYVGECVDPVEDELDTGNNCSRAIKVTVQEPDLVVSVSPDSASVAPGGSFDYVAVVRNEGNAASVATRARTFMSADSAVTTSDDLVGEPSEVHTLGPGESASRAASMTVSPSALPGTVLYVGECADPVVGESDTDNNCSAGIRVKVTGRPDLVAGVSPDSVVAAPGGSFGYAVEIRNRGDAASVPTTVGAFLSEDSVVTTSDELVGQVARVPALGPGEAVQGTALMTVSRSASPGTVLWVGECVGAVEGESDTGNNCSSAIEVRVRVLATGGHRVTRPAVAQRPGSGSEPPMPVLVVVVGPAGRLEFRPVARSSQPSAASVCPGHSWSSTGASSLPTLCRSSEEFVLVGSKRLR